MIVFAPSASGPLSKVSAAGGPPVQVTELDKARGDLAHRHPKFLPDGKLFVFFVSSGKVENSGVYLGTLDSKETSQAILFPSWKVSASILATVWLDLRFPTTGRWRCASVGVRASGCSDGLIARARR